MVKELKFWNGRGLCIRPVPSWVESRDTHLYIAAYSRADAARLIAERNNAELGGCGCRETGRYEREIANYFSPCWGNGMSAIIPERGLWLSERLGKPVQIWPVSSQEVSHE